VDLRTVVIDKEKARSWSKSLMGKGEEGEKEVIKKIGATQWGFEKKERWRHPPK